MNNHHYFWALKETSPDDIGYNQFSKKHLLMLLGVIVFTTFISILYIHSSIEMKSMIRKTIVVALIISEIFKFFVIIINRGDIFNYIPIEICSIAAYCIVIDAFSPNPTFVREMLLILFLPAAIMALIYPTSVCLPVFNFFTIHQIVFHGLIIAYVTMLFVSKEIMIDYVGVWKSIFTILCIAGVVYVIDHITNRNYMFLIDDYDNSMLKNLTALSGGGIKYTLLLVFFCILMIHVFYFICKLLEMFFLS